MTDIKDALLRAAERAEEGRGLHFCSLIPAEEESAYEALDAFGMPQDRIPRPGLHASLVFLFVREAL
jgi:hypothetical protein